MALLYAKKLYTVLDTLHNKLSAEKFGSWHLECDALVRLPAVRAVEGETAADAFITAHLEYDEIRRIVIRSAMAQMDYPLVENSAVRELIPQTVTTIGRGNGMTYCLIPMNKPVIGKNKPFLRKNCWYIVVDKAPARSMPFGVCYPCAEVGQCSF